MKRREKVEPVSRAHGLFQVTRLIQQLLDGVVAFNGAALDHLDGQELGQNVNLFMFILRLNKRKFAMVMRNRI